MGSFQDLGISDALAEVLSSQGINEPFEVQVESIPPAMEGKDVSCRAPTGSGKTLAFGLPMLEKVSYAEPNRPRALILTPTRELAEQIYGVLKPLARVIDRTVGTIYGGVSYKNQYRALERGLDVVVACPGRLLDLMERGAVVLKDVEVVVIDEADRMADMGFMEPVCDILDRCLPDRQTVLFSATLDDEVGDLIKRYQREPVRLEVGAEEVSITDMEHHFWLMPHSKKSPISAELIRNCGRTIIFCRTRLGVERVNDELLDDGLGVRGLHGGLSQRQRDRAMQAFKHGECMALVATDVAARGLDVEGVNCVIHYDPPENGKAYKHRSGRTARGGASGVVVSLVQRPQKKMYHRLQKNVGVNVDFTPPDFGSLPTFEVEYIPAEPRSRGRRDGGRRDGGRRDGGGGGGYGRRDGGRRDGGGGGGYGRRDGGRREVVAETVAVAVATDAEMVDAETVEVAVATDAETVEGLITIAMNATNVTVDIAEAMTVKTMVGREMTAEIIVMTAKVATNATTISVEMTEVILVANAKVAGTVAETVAEATTREATTGERTEEAVTVGAVVNLVKTVDTMGAQLQSERTILEVTTVERTRNTRAKEHPPHVHVPAHALQERTLPDAEALLHVHLSERSEPHLRTAVLS